MPSVSLITGSFQFVMGWQVVTLRRKQAHVSTDACHALLTVEASAQYELGHLSRGVSRITIAPPALCFMGVAGTLDCRHTYNRTEILH